MRRCLALAPALLLLAGCLDNTPIQPAPEDRDGLFHWTWVNYESASDTDLADATLKLDAAVDGGSLDPAAPLKGGLKDLTRDELTQVAMENGADPAKGRGLYIVNTFDCTLDKLEQIVSALDQKSQYPDAYDTYSRSYTSDHDAYFARTTNELGWDTSIGSAILQAKYTEHLLGGMRRVETSPLGPILFARTWMTAPAVFQGDGTHFDQDYQIEVFYERSPGHILHAYGMWREIRIDGLLTTDDAGMVNIIMDNLVKWDDQTAKLCAK